MTLKCKSIVINSLVGAGLSYYGPVLHCPDEYINKMERIKWSFFWDGKIYKIKRTTICAPQKRGGVGLVNIKLKLQSLRVNVLRKFHTKSGKWKSFFEYCLSRISGENHLGWYVLSNPKAVIRGAHPFCKQLTCDVKQLNANVSNLFSCVNETRKLPIILGKHHHHR